MSWTLDTGPGAWTQGTVDPSSLLQQIFWMTGSYCKLPERLSGPAPLISLQVEVTF
jgi:hypothetical protein